MPASLSGSRHFALKERALGVMMQRHPFACSVIYRSPLVHHVCTHRVDEPSKYWINAISLQQKLPTIPIPLLPGDGDVALDLQAAMDRCYETGPYKRRIKYSVPPQPPLPESLAVWAVNCVAASA